MTSLKQLLDHYCPGGVEYSRLSEAMVLTPGTRITKREHMGTAFPVYGGGGESFRTDDWNRENDWVISRFAMSPHCVRFVTGKFWLLDSGITFEPTEAASKQYIAHFLASIEDKIYATSSKSAQRNLKVKEFLKLEIPLPPREVQDKIVENLDTFAALCENLDTEIAQREQQFTVYREKLMSSLRSDSTLGDHGEFLRGKGIQKKDFLEKGRPAFHYGQVHTKYEYQTIETAAHISDELFERSTLALPGDLVIATTSEDDEAVAKAVAWLGTEPAAVGGDAHVYRHGYDPRFISYFFATHGFQRQKLMLLTGAKVRRVNASALESIKAPFPSLETQQAVAEKLDAMQELSDNLRLEREQRQKQFDYYREKLLSFPQKETAEV